MHWRVRTKVVRSSKRLTVIAGLDPATRTSTVGGLIKPGNDGEAGLSVHG